MMNPEDRAKFRLEILDVETSDLDTRFCEIFEIATIVTDLELNEIARKSWIADRYSLERGKARMSPEVLEMHTRSGLLAEIADAEIHTGSAKADIEAFLKQHTFGPKFTRLTGFSVHFDREVLRHNTDIDWDSFIHYRLCNVSTLREMARWWSPSAALDEVDKKENLPHRAMVDCERVLFELKHYKKYIFDCVEDGYHQYDRDMPAIK